MSLETSFKELILPERIVVERCDEGIILNDWRILIMGPTGAGKSSFIEAFSEDRSLCISKDQLEGFTQNVSTFRLTGVRGKSTPSQLNRSIYLIDTPGLADRRLSDTHVVGVIQRWLKDRKFDSYSRMLYFMPITDIRLSGSKRKIVDLFKLLTGDRAAVNVTIVTTMWDSLGGEQAIRRAEASFEQLRNDIWKDFVDSGANIYKFMNTQDSAFEILDNALAAWSPRPFFMDRSDWTGDLDLPINTVVPLGVALLRDLQSRIILLKRRKENLELELREAEIEGRKELEYILGLQLAEVDEDIDKFMRKLPDFGEYGVLPRTLY